MTSSAVSGSIGLVHLDRGTLILWPAESVTSVMATGVQYRPRAANPAYAAARCVTSMLLVPSTWEGYCCSGRPLACVMPNFSAILTAAHRPTFCSRAA